MRILQRFDPAINYRTYGEPAHSREHGAVLAGVRCAAGFVAGVVVVTTLLSLATLALLLTLLRV